MPALRLLIDRCRFRSGNDTQMPLSKSIVIDIFGTALAQGAEWLYAGKQPQILMKFALTLHRALS